VNTAQKSRIAPATRPLGSRPSAVHELTVRFKFLPPRGKISSLRASGLSWPNLFGALVNPMMDSQSLALADDAAFIRKRSIATALIGCVFKQNVIAFA
jgi:hypothetical protein